MLSLDLTTDDKGGDGIGGSGRGWGASINVALDKVGDHLSLAGVTGKAGHT